MSLQDDRHKRTPRDRFRNILSADKEDDSVPEARKSAVVNLPKIGGTPQPTAPEGSPSSAGTGPVSGVPSTPRWLISFWTAGGILSIIANLVLFMLLISTWSGQGRLGPGGSGAALLSAYTSLEQLDQGHIRATIPIQTSILLDASVPVKSTTNITLAQDVFMQGAHVTINTALFNIDAPANITLPAGTSLDVELDMILPMKTGLPIAVDVPVDIAVRDTDLHAAIQGLQESLKPMLCGASPAARLPDGTAICR